MLFVLFALFAARRAGAVQGLCGEQPSAWARRCSASSGLDVRARRCPPGKIVAAIYQGDRHLLDAEIGPVHGETFHRVGDYAVAPVGEFPDWNKVAVERRDALVALEKCLRDDPSLVVRWVDVSPQMQRHDEVRPPPQRVPWALIAALIVVAASAGLRFRRGARPSSRTIGGLALLAVGCFALRRWLMPVGFFHQNGHGPEWVLATLVDRPEFAAYGPGYPQLFACIAEHARWPDLAIFTAQSLAAALQPVFAWIIARRVGAAPAIATALAAWVAVDPVLGRAAQSESYFAVGATLGLLAAAVLADGAMRARPRSMYFLLAVLAAGLVVAQIALVHPILWYGAATLPLVAFAGRGRLRARLACTLVAGLGIGLVVALVAGRSMLTVLGGALGGWKSSMVARSLLDLRRVGPFVLFPAVLLILVPPRWRRRLAPFAALLVLREFAASSSTAIGTNPAVTAMWFRQCLPGMIALVAGGVAQLVPLLKRGRVRGAVVTRASGAVVLAAGVGWSALNWAELVTLPTDLREQSLALGWRTQLPAGAVVAYLSRAGLHIIALPIYGQTPRAAQTEPLWSDEALPHARDASGPLYYYRSSVCTTSDGAAFCKKAEAQLRLERVLARDLPAISSMAGQVYSSSTVHLELYRVLPD